MYNFRQANSAIDFSEISHVSKMMSDKIWGIMSFTAELIIEEQTHKLSHKCFSRSEMEATSSVLKKITYEFKPITFNQRNGLKEGQVGTRSAKGLLAWEGVTIAFICKKGRERW